MQVVIMFQKLLMEDRITEVTEISEKQETKGRPPGLNTVNLLKVRKFKIDIAFCDLCYCCMHSSL